MRLPACPLPVLAAMLASLFPARCKTEPGSASGFRLTSREADDLTASIDSALMDIVKANDDNARRSSGKKLGLERASGGDNKRG
jgi:hypothetical protein